jgi:hypothetical protein
MGSLSFRRRLSLLTLCLSMPCFAFGQSPRRVVHVFVALADNQHQGIVPVPAKLGNGDSPLTNLYWGATFGVKVVLPC